MSDRDNVVPIGEAVVHIVAKASYKRMLFTEEAMAQLEVSDWFTMLHADEHVVTSYHAPSGTLAVTYVTDKPYVTRGLYVFDTRQDFVKCEDEPTIEMHRERIEEVLDELNRR